MVKIRHCVTSRTSRVSLQPPLPSFRLSSVSLSLSLLSSFMPLEPRGVPPRPENVTRGQHFLHWARDTWAPSRSDFDYSLETPAGAYRKLKQNPLFEKFSIKNLWESCWIFIGCMISLLAISLTDWYGTREHNFPIFFAALGASATIMFTKPDAPFTQPYHILVGHTIPPAIAVTCQKILPSVPWLAASLSTASSITVMGLVGGVSPPGGALALLYPITPSLHPMGYLYVPASLLGVAMMWVVGFVVNNLQRHLRYPYSWI